MSTNSIQFVGRMKPPVFTALQKACLDAGVEQGVWISRAVEKSVYKYLPAELREELDDMDALYEAGRHKARQVFSDRPFDEHFTLTVFRELMADPETRNLYEKLIGVDYKSASPKKSPLNMYLGWYIKNAVEAEPILDEARKPRRGRVSGEAIKTYTLLKRKV